MSITQLVCGFVALGIQHAVRMRPNIICGQRGYTTLFNIVS
jgi:hypothetical protein